MVAWISSSRRRLNSRLPATSRPADQAECRPLLSTVAAIQAFRLFPSVRAATVAARCTAGETLRGILPRRLVRRLPSLGAHSQIVVYREARTPCSTLRPKCPRRRSRRECPLSPRGRQPRLVIVSNRGMVRLVLHHGSIPGSFRKLLIDSKTAGEHAGGSGRMAGPNPINVELSSRANSTHSSG